MCQKLKRMHHLFKNATMWSDMGVCTTHWCNNAWDHHLSFKFAADVLTHIFSELIFHIRLVVAFQGEG